MRNTINRVILDEVSYIYKYDEFKRFIDDQFEMPDKLVSMLVRRFLVQNGGSLSKRAKAKEFPELKEDEAEKIGSAFQEIFEN